MSEVRRVFGPVPSRRLGRSLGVDLTPSKVCTFDCVYCQVGRTTRLTSRRESFVPVAELLDEIRRKLATVPRPDHITLSGSGEPTLNSDLGRIIAGIRQITDVPIAVMTNGSLLTDPQVRAECAGADVVLPTLDAADEETFRQIHRPDPAFTLERIVAGVEAFRKEFHGQIWVEVFMIEGRNSEPDQARKLSKILARIKPDRIQLNTAVRPTADKDVTRLTEERLQELAAILGPTAEVIADFKRDPAFGGFAASADAVLDMVRRRPVTVADIAAGLGITQPIAASLVTDLVAARKVVSEQKSGKEFITVRE